MKLLSDTFSIKMIPIQLKNKNLDDQLMGYNSDSGEDSSQDDDETARTTMATKMISYILVIWWHLKLKFGRQVLAGPDDHFYCWLLVTVIRILLG